MTTSSNTETIFYNGYSRSNQFDPAELKSYCDRYKHFLSRSRTDRASVTNAISSLESNGFHLFEKGQRLVPGTKVYFNIRNCALVAVLIGHEDLSRGINIIASHIDSPRLDVMPTALIEDSEMVKMKTHYYGMVRRHQWVSIPLMIQGVVYKEDGTKVDVSIGDHPNDPVLAIPDLLPHISDDHIKLSLSDAYPAEKMNVLIGSEPICNSTEFNPVKQNILKILNQKYGIVEDDFATAELEIVPAIPVSDVGLDKSMIGAYAQDDKVCAFAALDALVHIDTPQHTAVVLWADKEEVGNNGITGAKSMAFDYCIRQLCKMQNCDLEECYEHSFCLSCDVTSAYDPNFAEYYSKENAARINHGIAVCKYTGLRGKEHTSDAKPELLSHVRTIFAKHHVLWQTAEMGRLDLGGGGTVALEFANRGIDTLDAGTAVLGMHSPFEVTSKLDCFMTFKACKAIFEET